jgi:hypothetical protein
MPNLVLGSDDAQLKRGRGIRVIRFVIKVGGEDDAGRIEQHVLDTNAGKQ